jgi:hypothetical protein
VLGRELGRGFEALEVFQWWESQNPREEEEGVFIPIPPKLAVGGPCGLAGSPDTGGWVTRLPPVPSRVARPLMPVDPVRPEEQGYATKD